LKPVHGTVGFDEQPLHLLPPHRVCEQRVALVPEGRQLFPEMTVRENLEIGAFTPRARAHAAANLRRQFELFPRLAERARLAAGALSGGERQLLAIARALMSEPRLLMLDEPSLGLSPVAVEHIFEVLDQLRQAGLTLLIVEQNVSHALELADRVYLLESGRVVREGSAAALENDPAIRRHFLGI
jgi:branched-chain amino acid transport system ATP-binding protein